MKDSDPRYVIYAKGKLPADNYSRIHVVIWGEPHKALAWLEEMIGNDEHTREGEVITLTASGITLKSEQLRDILEATPQGFDVPDQYSRWILRFKYGTWDAMGVKPDRVSTATIVTKRDPEAERTRRPVRPDGYVSITELCAASGIPAMIARAALRASGRIKPNYGWSFDPKELPAIKKLCGI